MVFIIFVVIFLLILVRKIHMLYIDKVIAEDTPSIDNRIIELLNSK
ncbi:hypothetical protein I6J18_12060 [Peribacillus psychrosaccharolyticus]|uniref:Uncharacterized protein n=1 Tax=Peribacillus psychrosaccharolyticus TaxID=1407 RepID=A0A974NIH4_PERPY|nr:hypothetical protein [Peribacillus psychrosaccharolyticus]MEC2056952.1 hypothetical protein [Peribacillus psychrosaccharolyticus]MED3744874.1 hypothetical protein [Peribacillus psychrosaccharolyticus]QQS98501.1 hypothetical protein I6J18_12060 [Peribacillus psychrosaccharolyticus]